ncbi:hypothetical protein [Rufibacter aurantiacus]|uniref:hypothetical protein n=1 Tax=Rufibacter aurantiacus TaxID=2817374 RepID=UPI001B30BC1B|nr:hypothetical protein [Rufibacter aurantiacus]
MGNSNSTGGILAILMFIATMTSWIGSGVVSWNLVEPDSFGGAVIFIIVWGIMGKVFDFVLGLIVAGIASTMD